MVTIWAKTMKKVWMNSAVTWRHMVFWLITKRLSLLNCYLRRRRASAKKNAEITSRPEIIKNKSSTVYVSRLEAPGGSAMS
jgi:hypothetical protein